MKLIKNPLIVLSLITVACGLVTIIARDQRPFTIRGILRTRRQGLKLALTTRPGWAGWRWCLGLTIIYGIAALPIGVLTGFLRKDMLAGRWGKFVRIALALLIQPGLLEELAFRALLLPHPGEGVSWRRTLVSAGAGLAAFILYHPLNGLTLSPTARPLFTDWAFLLQAALLGIACSAAYLISGSIWPSIFMHWLPVTIWILCFGGARRVARSVRWI